jgi:hypothetical protein
VPVQKGQRDKKEQQENPSFPNKPTLGSVYPENEKMTDGGSHLDSLSFQEDSNGHGTRSDFVEITVTSDLSLSNTQWGPLIDVKVNENGTAGEKQAQKGAASRNSVLQVQDFKDSQEICDLCSCDDAEYSPQSGDLPPDLPHTVEDADFENRLKIFNNYRHFGAMYSSKVRFAFRAVTLSRSCQDSIHQGLVNTSRIDFFLSS